MKLSVRGYAKINLFLDVESLRCDGYHNIVSFMQSIDLCDVVTVEILPSENKSISITSSSPDLPVGRDNIVYRAAERYPVCGEIKIHIEKNIPVSAGLAGGSADAAAALTALNALSDKPLSTEELIKLGGSLGADIPFCTVGGACVVKGIGEILEKVEPIARLPIVIARKGEGMSTPAAYRALDEKYDRFAAYSPQKDKLSVLLDRASVSDPYKISSGLYNVFEGVVEEIRPDVTAVKQIMRQKGALTAMMSGSGTSVFGIFTSLDDAQSAKEALIRAGAAAYIAYPCDRGTEMI